MPVPGQRHAPQLSASTAISGLLFVVQALGAVSRVWSGRWTDSRGGRHRRTLGIA
ncbi:hypothetical protein ABZ352_11395 [Streptomyces griseofuscus]|uniref:hypothetical protein n=1 Tax=Streptomyces griseofuscus TaxID=146922 RepID=UPI003402D2E8